MKDRINTRVVKWIMGDDCEVPAELQGGANAACANDAPAKVVDAVATGSEASRAGSDYEARLAEWKARMGYREPLDESDEADAALMAADRKLPGEDYCVLCGEGPQPISSLVLITRRTDPYIQMETEDGTDEDAPAYRVRACPRCYKADYEDEDEGPEPPNNKDQPAAGLPAPKGYQ